MRSRRPGARRRTSAAAVPLSLLLTLGAACAPARPAPLPAPAPDARAALRQFVDSLVEAPEWRNAHWGILIVDPERGDTLYSRNAGKLFMPASNQKILTGATALARLGPEYRFRTEVRAAAVDGQPAAGADGALHGDLVITGYGDPTISDHARGDAMTPLREIADSLRARGITRVTGRLRPGADNLPGPVLGFGWAWDDLDYPYSAGVDELLFNEGFSEVVVHGGARVGDSVRVRTGPARSFPRVRVLAGTAAAGTRRTLQIAHDSAAGGVVVSGTIAAGDSAVLRITHRDPTAAYLAALREALADRGVTVEEATAPAPPTAGAWSGAPLVTMQSPPLREILPLLEKPSQNQIAELLFRTLGRELAGDGSADSGRAVLERQLVAWGAARDGFAVRDGSGLSRHNYVTPETIVRVLDAARRDTAFRVFYESLPIAGVDGTIEGRMKGTPAEGNVHAKTGFIDKARSLSGYVTTADGVPLVFSFLANNWTTPTREVERVQDAISARLAGMQLRGPAAATAGSAAGSPLPAAR